MMMYLANRLSLACCVSSQFSTSGRTVPVAVAFPTLVLSRQVVDRPSRMFSTCSHYAEPEDPQLEAAQQPEKGRGAGVRVRPLPPDGFGHPAPAGAAEHRHRDAD